MANTVTGSADAAAGGGPGETEGGASGIGERIRQLRVKRRWSQADLASEAGVSRQYLGQIERGERTAIGGELLDRVAKSLGFENYHVLEEWEAGDWRLGPSPEVPVIAVDEEQLLKVAIEAEVSAGSGSGSRVDGYVYVDRREARGRALMAVRVRGECMVPILYPGDVVVCERVWRQDEVQSGALCVVILLDEGDEESGGNVKYVQWVSGRARLRAEDGTVRLVERDRLKVEGRVWRMIREF